MFLLVILSLFCLGALVYAWGLYPFLLARLAAVRPAAPASGARSKPTVSIILAAHNEEDVIGARLANLAEAARTAGERVAGVTVYVGVDGSTDQTQARAESFAGQAAGVRVYGFPQRRGKMATVKDLAGRAEGDILVFTDANTLFDRDALVQLLAGFADPGVGGVCGRLVFESATGAPVRETSYWEWETRLKSAESRLDSCLGANGAIYAVRRDLFWRAIPDNTIIDDFVVGMKVREQGYRMRFAEAAVAREETPPVLHHEWRRRVRIGAGNYQALRLCRRCLLPRYGWFAWMFGSHKVLRWFTPHMLLALLAAGSVLIGAGRVHGHVASCAFVVGLLAAGVPTGLLLAALAGRLVRGHGGFLFRVLQLCEYFVVMQAALLAGFGRFCRGDLSGIWQRTPRGAG